MSRWRGQGRGNMPFVPGFWEAVRIGEEKRLAVRQVEGKLVLVTHTFDGEQAEADVRLMAVAPDMYEALEFIAHGLPEAWSEIVIDGEITLTFEADFIGGIIKMLAKVRGGNHEL